MPDPDDVDRGRDHHRGQGQRGSKRFAGGVHVPAARLRRATGRAQGGRPRGPLPVRAPRPVSGAGVPVAGPHRPTVWPRGTDARQRRSRHRAGK